MAREEIDNLRLGKSGRVIKKAVDQELLKILLRFGLAQARDSSLRAMNTTKGLRMLIDPKLLKTKLKSKNFRIKLISRVHDWTTKRAKEIDASTRKMLFDNVRRVLTQAAQLEVAPSMGEVARSIRLQISERGYGFSQLRAATIARFEIRQAETLGRVETFEAAGVKKQKWIAHRDGKSGKRHHELMNGQIQEVGKPFVNPTTKVKLMHPLDPKAPLSETINCRCHIVAVITGDE